MHIVLVQIRGRSFAEAGRICDPLGGDAGHWSCAQAHQDTPGHTFFGQALNRSSCFLRVDAASKESFIGREGLTKLCSMVLLYDLKMTELVSLRPFAMYSWLMTVEQSKYIEQLISARTSRHACSSRSGGASGSSGPVGKSRKKKYRLRLRQAQRRCSFD